MNNKTTEQIHFPDKDFKIVSVADKIPKKDNINTTPSIFHEEIEIKLFFDGTATLLIGDETVVADSGDVVFINPYQFHSTINFDEKEAKYHLLMISPDFFDTENMLDLRRIFVKDRIAIKPLIRQNPRLSSIIKEIVTELNNKSDLYKNVVRGLVLELFSLMLRDYKSGSNLSLPQDKNIAHYEVISPAIIRIRENYAQSFSIDELADMCKVSKFHFCRIFKEVTALSPLQYQNEYRIKVADVFLKHGNKSIAEIAELCGFNDVSYFSRCYKKHTGMSPQKARAILSK